MSCVSLSNNTISLTQSRIGDEIVEIVLCFVVTDSGMSDNMKLSYEVSAFKISHPAVNTSTYLFQATKERFPDPAAYVVLLESACLNMSKAKMKEKKSIFIFDEFDKKNSAFMYIYNAKTVQ